MLPETNRKSGAESLRHMKKYRAGMFGGKFLPYHRGHLYCLEEASRLCGRVYQLLLYGGAEEEAALRALAPERRDELAPEKRFARMREAGDRLGNVVTLRIDISACVTEDGREDWEAETPLVLEACGRFDAVFGSEPSYAEYFARAYPWAEYVLVDPARERYPVSGTMIRAGLEEAKRWML